MWPYGFGGTLNGSGPLTKHVCVQQQDVAASEEQHVFANRARMEDGLLESCRDRTALLGGTPHASGADKVGFLVPGLWFLVLVA